MKVKLDENVPRSANQVLIAAGHDVDTVVEENRAGAIDPQVAAAVGRLLITLDRGLGDIRASTRRAVMPGSSCCDQQTSRCRPWWPRSPS